MPKLENYQYDPTGKVSGSIRNIPETDCRICGGRISQPLPTGIWLHSGFNSDSYDDRLYGGDEHIPIPATLIESLLIQNQRESRDYGNGQCQLHRKYWLQQTKLKKKEIIEMIGNDNHDHWNYWNHKCERLDSLSVEKFVKSKDRTRTRNFPLPKIMIVCKFRDKIMDEFEILLNTDNLVSSWNLNDKIVFVGKKKYVIRGDPYMKKVSTKRNEWSFSVKELGKYDKERLSRYDKDEVKQFRHYFKKEIELLDNK